MPAPTPIEIRYGDPGLLGALALATGAAQAEEKQRARDQAIVQANLESRERRRQALDQQLARDMQQVQYQPQQGTGVQTFRRERDTMKERQARRARQEPTAMPGRQQGTPLSKAITGIGQEGYVGKVPSDLQYKYEGTSPPGQEQEQGGFAQITTPDETFLMEDGEIRGYRNSGEPIPSEELLEDRSQYVFSEPDPEPVSPLTQAKQAYAQALGESNLPPQQRRAIQQMVQNPEMDLSQFRLALNEVMPDTGGVNPAQQTGAKQAYAQSVGADRLPQDQQEAVRQMIENPAVDLSQFRMAMSRALPEPDPQQLSPRQQIQLQVQDIDRQTRRRLEQADDIAEQFTSIERGMSLDEFAQKERETVEGAGGWFSGTSKAEAQEAAEQRIEAFRQYKQTLAEANLLRAQRNSLIQGGQQPRQQVTPRPQPRQTQGPRPGDIDDGHRFRGGDPGDPNNWIKVQ